MDKVRGHLEASKVVCFSWRLGEVVYPGRKVQRRDVRRPRQLFLNDIGLGFLMLPGRCIFQLKRYLDILKGTQRAKIITLIVHADPTTVYNAPLVISNCKTILQGDLIKVDAEASISNVNPKICSRSLHLKTVSNPTERTALDGPLMIDTFYLRYHNHKSSKLVSTFLNLFEFLRLGNRTAESMGQKSHGGHGHWITKWIDHRFLLMGISIHNFVTGASLILVPSKPLGVMHVVRSLESREIFGHFRYCHIQQVGLGKGRKCVLYRLRNRLRITCGRLSRTAGFTVLTSKRRSRRENKSLLKELQHGISSKQLLRPQLLIDFFADRMLQP
ncbi:predicted protein [Sclerotinia sclerotiorum 1980 UF-70]|uniref:Uncharacterized protein n=1 Tax=Sclerotinia sclerotiorum (strain ATCC 18683 / 1980 / Ss-1) TaxID=665079 RepID=A7F5H5_SCLS1|nr:predicted protein [Sclerotinia sclerotiorum 1980 UF-70]EDN97996.1 predicted protein [Sclerotinia sclerotiorum 1980 UF-70]